MEAAINSILLEMQPFLESSQLKRLRDALKHAFEPKRQEANKTLLQAFLTAKEVEGCSLSTLRYYEDTLTRALAAIGKPIGVMVSDDLRQYLNDYEVTRHTSKVTIDNYQAYHVEFLFVVGGRGLYCEEPRASYSPSQDRASYQRGF